MKLIPGQAAERDTLEINFKQVRGGAKVSSSSGQEIRPTEIKDWSTRGFRTRIKILDSEGGPEAKASQALGVVSLLYITHSPSV